MDFNSYHLYLYDIILNYIVCIYNFLELILQYHIIFCINFNFFPLNFYLFIKYIIYGYYLLNNKNKKKINKLIIY